MALSEIVEGDLTKAHPRLPVIRDTDVPTGRPYPAYQDSNVEWLGRMPAHWQVRRLSSLARILNGATPSSANPSYWGGDVPWVTPTDLGTLEGHRLHRSARTLTDAGYENCGTSLAPDGSIALSTRAPIGHVGILGVPCCSNQGCRLLVPNDSIESDFFYYALATFREELKALGQGSTFTELSREHLAAFRIGLPPRAEQATIVRFLDNVDGRVRRAIREKERLLELLDEQRLAVIEKAVTGHVDVRTGNPPSAYRDSGVDWLPRVPAHWTMRRNKWLFAERNETGHGDLPVLEVSLRSGVGIRDMEDGARKQRMTDRDKYKRAARGDIAYNTMRLWQGALGVVPVDGLVSPAYVVARPLRGVEVSYYAYLFRTGAYKQEVDRNSRGIVSDRNRLYWDAFKRLASPRPPPEEQRLIVEYLDTESGRIDADAAKIRRQIALLREYRDRLLADVVTGKLDVGATVQRDEPQPGAGHGEQQGPGRVQATTRHAVQFETAKSPSADQPGDSKGGSRLV